MCPYFIRITFCFTHLCFSICSLHIELLSTDYIILKMKYVLKYASNLVTCWITSQCVKDSSMPFSKHPSKGNAFYRLEKQYFCLRQHSVLDYLNWGFELSVLNAQNVSIFYLFLQFCIVNVVFKLNYCNALKCFVNPILRTK